MTAGGRFVRGVLLRQAAVGLAALFVIFVFAHKLIILDWQITRTATDAGATIALSGTLATLVVSWLHARTHARVVDAISAGGVAAEEISPEALARLVALPSALTLRFVIVQAASTLLLLAPGVRPELLDDSRTAGLLILANTILGASALPHYVLARQATVRVLELAPLEPFHVVLEALRTERVPERLVTQRLLLAVVPPVALLGAGAVLVAHAHLRTLVESSRSQTAQMIARTALEPSPGARAARETAIAAAAQLGFEVEVAAGERGESTITREPDGRMAVSEPVDDGRAIIRFRPEVASGDTRVGAIVTLSAVSIAALLAWLLGKALANDLVGATRSVRLLGTDSVIRGGTRIARPARFSAVAELGGAIEGLTERFRVFAAAQERALDAKLAAQRMRGLLFASVSHDLKSPLNAILGFAELLAAEGLSTAQKESLDLIEQRGRELLALIEIILDAARVEAGQLQLHAGEVEVAALLADATRKARELASETTTTVDLEIAGDIEPIALDPTYGVRAIAVIVAHALRNAGANLKGGNIRVRAQADRDPTQPLDAADSARGVRLDVEYGPGALTPEELEGLFARRATSRARGITLGLSLARSVVELHGGRVSVERAPDGSPVCRIHLPRDAEAHPRLSSIPALA